MSERRWQHSLTRIRIIGTVCAALAAVSLDAAAQKVADAECAKFYARIGDGAYDYRTAPEREIHAVEGAHFKPEHQRNAMRGEWKARNGTTWGNLDYTLRALPNHPRALYMMGLLEINLKRVNEAAWRRLTLTEKYVPFTCYFERAARFTPDDAGVPNALGILLHRSGKPEEAVKSFQRAVELAPDAPEAHYNLGLSQFALGQYEQSAASARRAYELGYQKQDLKVKLKRKGHW